MTKRLAPALMGAAAALTLATASADAQYFKGKTISLIVGFGAGGGVDLSARGIAEYLPKYIPGNPTVIVKNMPGGSSMKAHNFVFEGAKGDGQTLLFGPWFPASQLVGAPGIRFKYQDFALVGALRTAGYVVYGRTDLVPGGLKTGADIVKAKDVKVAGQNPFNIFDLHTRLSLEMLGVPYRYITGYRGSSNIRPAVMKGEANIAMDSATGYYSVVLPNMVKPGIVKPLWSFMVKGEDGKWMHNPYMKQVPSIADVYKKIHGKEPAGDKWEMLEFVVSVNGSVSHLVLGPPSLNKQAQAALSKGFYGALNDPEFRAKSAKRFRYAPDPVSLKRAREVMKILTDINPRVLANLKAHIAEGRKKK